MTDEWLTNHQFRTDDEKSRGKHCGFVAFMSRKDGERALNALLGKNVSRLEKIETFLSFFIGDPNSFCQQAHLLCMSLQLNLLFPCSDWGLWDAHGLGEARPHPPASHLRAPHPAQVHTAPQPLRPAVQLPAPQAGREHLGTGGHLSQQPQPDGHSIWSEQKVRSWDLASFL